LQQTAAAAVTAAVAAANYILRPHCNPYKDNNVVVPAILACSVLLIANVVALRLWQQWIPIPPSPDAMATDAQWH
jgi:hypothetical protein